MQKSKGKIFKLVRVLAKIGEIAHWIGIGLMVALAICAVVAGDWLTSTFNIGFANMSFYGFRVTVANSAGEVDWKVILMFAIGSAAICPFMAMILRNVCFIVKTAEQTTPFNKDNIRKLKQIGIFAMVIPVVGLVMGIITSLVMGIDTVDYVYVNGDGLVVGLIVLALTHVFAYGVKLEEDVEGLV